jgi:GNAT superfamily N-acetyltransferase
MHQITTQSVEPTLAEQICRSITLTLPEWFGIPEANERYAKGVVERTSFAASIHGEYIGLITLEFQYDNNANIYWMAVKKEYHAQQIGTKLIRFAEQYCKTHTNATSMTVETLSPKQNDIHYLPTYRFYKKLKFLPLFEMHTYGPDNLMVYMYKSITEEY